MALYSEKVMDHFMNPRNVGHIENADGVGEIGNAKCGDIMKIYLKIENDTIVDAKFETFGCGSAIASSSMAPVQVIKSEDFYAFRIILHLYTTDRNETRYGYRNPRLKRDCTSSMEPCPLGHGPQGV